MALVGKRTFVGFGFGPIQAGLFVQEAFQSGAFGRLVVAEVVPALVAAVRAAAGHFSLNVAHADRIETYQIGPVDVCDPAQMDDRERLVTAVAVAEEMATAVPSIDNYRSAGAGSIHRILAEGLRRKAAAGGPRAVVYAAENHNHAAEILESYVLAEVPAAEHAAVRSRVRFVNTVIGKMSGVISDPDQMRLYGLEPIAPGYGRAFLVEAFNRILISRIRFDTVPPVPVGEGGGEGKGEGPFQRGILAFEEKDDLLPFEEAKLYGHNATHALGAYLGIMCGVQRIADLPTVPGMMAFLRDAFIQESGEALVRRHAGKDELFTRAGYAAYADDLLARMTNPYLLDTAERVGRDPGRKLRWDDRLIGTMRLALTQGIEPWRYALGAAAALAFMDSSVLGGGTRPATILDPLWHEASPDGGERRVVLRLVDEALARLRAWRAAGYPDLTTMRW